MDFSLLTYMMIDDHGTGKTYNIACEFLRSINKIIKDKHHPVGMLEALDHFVTHYRLSTKDIDQHYYAECLVDRKYLWPHLRPPTDH